MSAVVADFLGALDQAGLTPAEPIADRLGGGELVRFQAVDDRKGRANAWAVLHLDGIPAGAFGSWKWGVSQTWRAHATRRFSTAERADFAMRQRLAAEHRKAEREARHAEVAADSLTRWNAASPADPAHPYLVRKNISSEGLRQQGRALLVPMFGPDRGLWNIQSIYGDGTKLFAKGGRQEGLFYIIGNIGEKVVIGEGYSTLAAIRRATGFPVVVAFNAQNLMPVAVTIRDRFPGVEIVVAADDDAHLVDHPKIQKNVGVEAAKDAARAVGGRVAMPPRGN